MTPKTIRLILSGLAALGLCAAALVLSGPRIALATPAFQFNSEILAHAFFEEIAVNTKRHHDRRHFDRHHDGNDDDDDMDENGHFRVKIEARDPSDVYIVRNKVPPGGYSGWHTHPGPSIVSVKAGTATVYDGDDPSCPSRTYPAGTGFIDEGGGHVHMVRNEGTVELEVVAFQIIPAGAERRIDVPNPGVCPF